VESLSRAPLQALTLLRLAAQTGLEISEELVDAISLANTPGAFPASSVAAGSELLGMLIGDHVTAALGVLVHTGLDAALFRRREDPPDPDILNGLPADPILRLARWLGEIQPADALCRIRLGQGAAGRLRWLLTHPAGVDEIRADGS
jgi:hypothetical protein